MPRRGLRGGRRRRSRRRQEPVRPALGGGLRADVLLVPRGRRVAGRLVAGGGGPAGTAPRSTARAGDSVGLPGHSRASGGCGTGSNASPGALARAAPADSGLPKRLALLSAALLEILGDLAWAATAAARTQQTQRGAALLCSWSSSRMASGSLGALGEPVSGRAPSGQ
ncbi:unnamed protein product [Prorocentrum cordatum]|uniref:Uncharacterized protein n=1 Tax=Prorocentrum cordatum TaxID=2364126 RepID=A0ABN9XLS6_9DINO|nr:unnamed protein product [Polarella glacialis]